MEVIVALVSLFCGWGILGLLAAMYVIEHANVHHDVAFYYRCLCLGPLAWLIILWEAFRKR